MSVVEYKPEQQLAARPLPIGRFTKPDLDPDTVAALTADRVDAYVDRFGQLWRWDAFKVRYVRTPAGAKRYGVPIGSPIPVGRRLKPKKGRRRRNRVQLASSERRVSNRAFGGDVDHGARINDRGELEITDNERAKKRLDAIARNPGSSDEDRKAAADLRRRIDVLPPDDDEHGDDSDGGVDRGDRADRGDGRDGERDAPEQQPDTAEPEPEPARQLSGSEVTDDYQSRMRLSDSERAAVRSYTGGGYHDINRALRGQPLRDGTDPQQVQREIDALNSVMSRYTTPGTITAHRSIYDEGSGTGIPPGDITGQVITTSGFVSTAVDEPAAGYRHGTDHMEITIPAGMRGLDVAGSGAGQFGGDEREFILPHGARFRVDSVEFREVDGERQRLLRVTALPPSDDGMPLAASASRTAALVIGRFVGAAFKVRYVRTPAGARRYGVPIGSPIPVGRRVKPKKGRRRRAAAPVQPGETRKRTSSTGGGSKRISVPPAQRSTARRHFWVGSDPDETGALWDDDTNELEVRDPQKAQATLDRVLQDSWPDADEKRQARRLRDRIAADTGDDGNEPPRPPDTPDTVDGAPEPPRNPYDPVSTEGWTRTGGPAGSTVRNNSGFYRDPDGGEHYVKTPSSEDAARNEVLAGQLYNLAGVDVATTRLADHNGRLAVDSEIVPGSRPDLADRLNDPEYKRQLQEGFAADAWLANWDVAGLDYDNVVSDRDGNPVRIDAGGALMYRAQGAPKGDAFGDSVGEWDTLRDGSNPNAAALFGDMTDEQLRASAQRVLNVSPQQIDEAVDAAGFDSDTAAKLKDRLKARRLDIARRAGLTPPEQQGAPDVVDTPNGRSAPDASVTGPQTHELPFEERGVARRHFWNNSGANGAEWDDDTNQLRVTDPELAASELDRALANPSLEDDTREVTQQLRDRIAPGYDPSKPSRSKPSTDSDGPGAEPDFNGPEMDADQLTADYEQRISGVATTTEKQAVNWYTGTGFVLMNDYLRDLDSERWTDDWRTYMDRQRVGPINDLFGKYTTPAPATVHRFVSERGIPDGTVPGRVVTMSGLVSTTMVNRPPPLWEDSPVVMTIKVPKGMPAIIPDGIGVGKEHERELILPHGTRFRVDSVEDRDGKRWLELTALPPEMP